MENKPLSPQEIVGYLTKRMPQYEEAFKEFLKGEDDPDFGLNHPKGADEMCDSSLLSKSFYWRLAPQGLDFWYEAFKQLGGYW